ncbi:MAG: hypothetical protein AB8G05_16230 [Oligoflexales bacterium]
MNIKKFLLSCLAFSSFSYTQAFGLQIYSDGPIFGDRGQTEGSFFNCTVDGAENIKHLDAKVREIISQEKFNGHSDFKKQVTDIAKIAGPREKLTAYMGLIGLQWPSVPGFLIASTDGLKSYADNLQANTGLPTDLGIEVLGGLQSAINQFMGSRSQQSQQA